MPIHSVFLSGESHGQRSPAGTDQRVAKSQKRLKRLYLSRTLYTFPLTPNILTSLGMVIYPHFISRTHEVKEICLTNTDVKQAVSE